LIFEQRNVKAIDEEEVVVMVYPFVFYFFFKEKFWNCNFWITCI